MANQFGLFAEGLLIPTLDDLRGDLDADFRGEYGPNFPLGDGTLAGFLSGALTERLALLWDQLDRIYDASDRDRASGQALEALGILNGTVKPKATFSSATLTLCGDPGTPVPEGSSVRTPDTLRVFSTKDDDVELAALVARLPATSYAIGDRVTNAVRCYQCLVPGVTGGGGDAPTTTDLDIEDGDVHWTYIGEGTAAADVFSLCDVAGPIEAAARGITEPVTPIPGVLTWTNLLDADLGQLVPSDEDFRLLIESDVATSGTGTTPAIAADVRQVSGVTYVAVFENPTDVVVDGLPPHSFEVLAQGGLDQEIRDAILANKGAGITTVGNVVGTATDDEGNEVTIKFSRPIELPIYVQVTLVKDPTKYVGDARIREIVAFSPSPIGQDAVSSRLIATVFSGGGVIDVPRSGSLLGVLISVSPSPTSDATIPVTTRQLATFDTSRVTVISSDGAP